MNTRGDNTANKLNNKKGVKFQLTSQSVELSPNFSHPSGQIIHLFTKFFYALFSDVLFPTTRRLLVFFMRHCCLRHRRFGHLKSVYKSKHMFLFISMQAYIKQLRKYFVHLHSNWQSLYIIYAPRRSSFMIYQLPFMLQFSSCRFKIYYKRNFSHFSPVGL